MKPVPGTILQVNISKGGLPKLAILTGFIATLGIEGDRHANPAVHGGPRKAVLLIASETVNALIAMGYPVFAGALGENLSTSGLDYRELRIGDRLRAGEALLEITQPRGPCINLDIYGPAIKGEIYDARVKRLDHTAPHWGMSGFYARVLSPGRVQPGDIIALVAESAE